MQIRLCLFALLVAVAAHADELTKSVQNTLKDQGFYYGEITGVNSPETAAAVKRFQIRNGLEVTGTLTKETMTALGMEGEAAPIPGLSPTPPTRVAKPAPEPPIEKEKGQRPPANLRRDSSPQKSDQDYLRRQQPAPPSDEPSPIPPPAPVAPQASGPYGHLFARTPYASAPREVQESTVKQAQRFLRDLDFYHQPIDGQPSPDLEEGVLSYQRFIRLPLTGQLDLETLAAMRLLPGRGGYATKPANPAVRVVPGRPLKGVWIQ